MKIQGLVSVVMSVYNDADYVGEAINSLLRQTYKNIEIIVVNDASTDGTLEVLKCFGDKIKLINNAKNMKLAHNLNLAISESQGEYIARMDADDISAPNRIETQVRFMEENPDIDICGSYAKAFGASDNLMKYPAKHDEIKATLLFENAFCHPAVMFRKKSIDFQYDERLSASQDYELWSRVIWNKRFANIPEVLLNYRIHDGQTKFKNGLKQKAGAIQARKQMLEKLRVTSEDDVGIFNWLCAVGVQRTKAELKKIENSLISILNANKEWKIFDDDTLRQLCGEYFFSNWYFSLADKSVGIKDMRNSPFSYVMRRKGIDVKMKILYKYALKKFGGYEWLGNIFKNRAPGGFAYV